MARRPVTLVEFVASGPTALAVDREAGVIRGVKVIGLTSKNRRRYTPEALQAACPLYEGIAVNVDHPRGKDGRLDATVPRSTNDTMAWLENVKAGPDGLYGDLHYLKSHAMAETLCEAAERNPRLFGLSHNAEGEGHEDAAGVFVIDRITEVRSVDLVVGPATTNGLFEQETRMKTHSFRSILEATRKLFAKKPNKTKAVKALLELDDADPALMADVATDEPDADDALADGFRAACLAVIDDDTMDAAAKVAKLKTLLTTHEKLQAPDDAPDDTEEPVAEEDDPAEGDDTDKKAMEQEVARLRTNEAVRVLCEQAQITVSPAKFKALAALPTAAERKALLEEFRLDNGGKPTRSRAPVPPPAPKRATPEETAAALLAR